MTAPKRRSIGQSPALLTAMKLLRELLPGDSSYGDPLSTARGTQAGLVGRRLAELTAERPGVLREAGLSALQVWEAVAQSREPTSGAEELTIAFTDLAEFSTWALSAGDAAAVELLRAVSAAIEPPVKRNRGEVVKRLGDGMMAVFPEPEDALAALLSAREELATLEVEGYAPKLRAGIHVGRAQRVGDDYFGVDVNVAARVAEQASGDEVLITDAALSGLELEDVEVRRKRFFRGKGVPSGVSVHSVKARS